MLDRACISMLQSAAIKTNNIYRTTIYTNKNQMNTKSLTPILFPRKTNKNKMLTISCSKRRNSCSAHVC